MVTKLEEVAFQSERSQIIYNEIKNIRERLVNPEFKRGRKPPASKQNIS